VSSKFRVQIADVGFEDVVLLRPFSIWRDRLDHRGIAAASAIKMRATVDRVPVAIEDDISKRLTNFEWREEWSGTKWLTATCLLAAV
jgi:hypothetical protein